MTAVAPDPIDMCKASLAGERLLRFMEYTWQKPREPLVVGKHTREIADRLDRAIEDYKKGISSYIQIVVPFRHGKSDISSRFLPAYFFGHDPDAEVIQASYGAELSEGFSTDMKSIMESEEYAKVFPHVKLASGSNSAKKRRIQDRYGKYAAVGAEGGATGKGAHLLVIDDFFKDRAEAESPTLRKKRWEAFSQVFISRLAPVHIVLVLNTRWHVDDISGNILSKNDPDSDKYDENFPVFEHIHYRAREGEEGEYEYLFPERYPESWYVMQFAMQGRYGAAANLQGEPTLRGGNMFNMAGLRTIGPEQVPDDLLWCRFWDLASTEKERDTDDPDWTAGAKVAYREYKGIPQLFVSDMQTCQEEAPKRNAMIRRTAEGDGPEVWQAVESVAGYKDSYTTLKDILKGKSVVYKATVSKDKIVRASVLEPLFDAGMIFFVRGSWNKKAETELAEFPACVHDDQTDGISGGYEIAKRRYEESKSLSGGLGKGAR